MEVEEEDEPVDKLYGAEFCVGAVDVLAEHVVDEDEEAEDSA